MERRLRVMNLLRRAVWIPGLQQSHPCQLFWWIETGYKICCSLLSMKERQKIEMQVMWTDKGYPRSKNSRLLAVCRGMNGKYIRGRSSVINVGFVCRIMLAVVVMPLKRRNSTQFVGLVYVKTLGSARALISHKQGQISRCLFTWASLFPVH